MRKLITIFLILLSVITYGQQSNFTNTKFINGLASSSGAAFPTTGLSAGMLHYKTTAPIGMHYYTGSAWVLISFGGGTVTSITPGWSFTSTTPITSTGTLTEDSTKVQTVLNFFPKGDTRWIKTTTAASTYVPYTGATANINIGTRTFTAGAGSPNGFVIDADGNLVIGEKVYIDITGTASFDNNSSTGQGVFVKGGDLSTLASGTRYALRVRAYDGTDIASFYKDTIVFNKPLSLLGGVKGAVTSVAALTLGTTGTDLTSSVATGTTTPVITLNVPTASASNRGALSSTDWSTFNSKQPAGNYITALTGDVTASGSGSVAATLATVNASPGTYGSATQAPVFVVNGKGLVTSNTNTTITPAVGSITGLGTGVATALGVNVGSAGAPVLFNGAGGTPSSMTLTSATGLPLATGVTGTLPVANGGTGATSYTSGSIPFSNGTILTQNNSNLFWDNSNISLGVGTQTPSGSFEVYKSINSAVKSYVTNINAGVAANAGFYATNDATDAGSFSLNVLGVNYTTSGGLIQNSGILKTGANLTGGISIISGTTAPVRIYSNNTLALAIDGATQAATFSASVTSPSFTGALTGNASTATSLAGGSGGTIPYQSAVGTTAMLANGTAGYVLQANGTTIAPSWFNLIGTANTWTASQTIAPAASASFLGLKRFNNTSSSYLSLQTGVTTDWTVGQGIVSGDATAFGIHNTNTGTDALKFNYTTNAANFTGTVTMPAPFTLGSTSVTSTGTQLNYLASATGTTGTTSTNLVYSTSPTFTGLVTTERLTSTINTASTFAASIINSHASGAGLFIRGGSTSGETALQIYNNSGGTQLFAVFGDGSTQIGGALSLGTNNINTTGSLGSTGARLTKGWLTNLESTNMPTVGGTSLSSTFAPIAGTMYIGTTAVALNRASAALTLAGITLTTPDIGTPSAGVVTNLTGTASININGTVGATTRAAGKFTTGDFSEVLTLNTNAVSTTAINLNGATNSQYIAINSGVGYDAMSLYSNATAGSWYTGVRSVAGIGATSSYHIFSSTLGTDVLALTTGGAAVFVGGITGTAATFSSLTASQLVATDGSKNLVSVTALPAGTTLPAPVFSGTPTGTVTSGTYTPTLTNTTNVSSSTPRICHYIRVGNEITITGTMAVTTTAGVATVIGISLPVTSNLATDYDLSGVGSMSATTGTSVVLYGDTTNDRATLSFTAVIGAGTAVWFTFSYTVI